LNRRYHPLYCRGFTAWIVDVNHHALGPAGIKQFPNKIGAVLHRRFPDRQLAALLAGFNRSADNAHRDRRNPEQSALDRAGNGAGISNVVGEILPTIYAR